MNVISGVGVVCRRSCCERKRRQRKADTNGKSVNATSVAVRAGRDRSIRIARNGSKDPNDRMAIPAAAVRVLTRCPL